MPAPVPLAITDARLASMARADMSAAVRAIRDRDSLGLKEGRKAIERILAEYPDAAPEAPPEGQRLPEEEIVPPSVPALRIVSGGEKAASPPAEVVNLAEARKAKADAERAEEPSDGGEETQDNDSATGSDAADPAPYPPTPRRRWLGAVVMDYNLKLEPAEVAGKAIELANLVVLDRPVMLNRHAAMKRQIAEEAKLMAARENELAQAIQDRACSVTAVVDRWADGGEAIHIERGLGRVVSRRPLRDDERMLAMSGPFEVPPNAEPIDETARDDGGEG